MQATVLPYEVVSAILADLWPASLEPAILPRGPSPPDPHAAGWGWSFSLCRARSLGRDAVVLGGHGPGRQPLRRLQPPRTPGSGLHQDQHPHHQQRDAAGAPATPHLDFTSADRSPTIPATGPMPPRSGSSSRPSPPRG